MTSGYSTSLTAEKQKAAQGNDRPFIPLSFSRMGDAACPYRFKVLHIDRSYKEPETEALKTGSDVARLLAAYRRHCYQAGLSRDMEFFERFDSENSDAVKGFLKAFIYSEFATVPLEAKWVQIEERFAYDRDLQLLTGNGAWTRPNVGFRAVVDFAYQLGDTLVIVDDKTGYGDPDHLQLEIYACLGTKAFTVTTPKPITVNRVVCNFNELGKRTTETLEFSLFDAMRSASTILGEMERINSWTEYPATACAKCKYCSVPGCEVREQTEKALVAAGGSPVIAVPREITTKEVAEKALEFVVFVDALVDEIKGKLKDYVATNGAVYSGGMAAQINETESWMLHDLKRVVNALANYGIDPAIIWRNLSLTKTAVEKILKQAKSQDKLPLLMYMIETKKEERFSIGKDKMAA